ncbi:hypothetical protein [Alteribacillus bidgolensis]|uniref:Uncharacterized protein n=1 Tax=Alteribacillus bidgolensis TaxID=930129 RepID=A0A1G8FZ75_9BACI|nr:hypothetical protein [Alteribacillus bidgolensis]SDH87390.1 hypothetical protein SAMN05216352_103152 [Alteribacillus bidgolensis]
MSKSFEERMKELEEGYNTMPDTTSPEKIIQNVEKKKKKSSWKKIYAAGGSVLAAGLATLLIMSQPGVLPGGGDSEMPQGSTSKENEQPSEDSKQEEDIPAFTKERAVELMNDYKESFVSLINEAGNDQKIDSYQTKEEVKEHFETTMSGDLAEWMTDSYFKEEGDGVYVIAKDGPTWLEEDQPFELEEVTEKHVKIVQERDNELLGNVEMIFHAGYQGDKWVVDEIESNEAGEFANETNSDLTNTAQTVINMITSQDMKTLASHVHPDKGVLFSPYVNIDEDTQVFQQEEVENFFEDEQVYEWGVYDGRGNTIELTPSEYYEEFIYEPELQDADEILVDELKQRGNMKNNIKDVFPEAAVVEYHIESSEEEGMDWASLNIVLEQDENNTWKLVAIVHDEWTI